MLILFNQICINEEMLPKYTLIYASAYAVKLARRVEKSRSIWRKHVSRARLNKVRKYVSVYVYVCVCVCLCYFSLSYNSDRRGMSCQRISRGAFLELPANGSAVVECVGHHPRHSNQKTLSPSSSATWFDLGLWVRADVLEWQWRSGCVVVAVTNKVCNL